MNAITLSLTKATKSTTSCATKAYVTYKSQAPIGVHITLPAFHWCSMCAQRLIATTFLHTSNTGRKYSDQVP